MDKTSGEAQTLPLRGPWPVSRGVLAAPPLLPFHCAWLSPPLPGLHTAPTCPWGPSDRSPGLLGTVRSANSQAGLEQPTRRQDKGSWPGTHLYGKQKARARGRMLARTCG